MASNVQTYGTGGKPNIVQAPVYESGGAPGGANYSAPNSAGTQPVAPTAAAGRAMNDSSAPPISPNGQVLGVATQANPKNVQVQSANQSADQTSNSVDASGNYNIDLSKVPQGPVVSPYKQGFEAAKAAGVSAPGTAGEAASVVKNNVPPPPPDTSNIDAALANDKGYQQLLQDQKDFNDVANQHATLTDTYKQLINDAGIPAINTELLNTQKVINGTEQDIRSEVQAVSGFATDSQIMALSSARNKQLIQNYNNLLNTKQMAMEQVNTMIGLAKEDQATALSNITAKMGIDEKLMTYRDKFVQNAQEGFNNIIKTQGYDGLYKSLVAGGDPTTVTLAEKTLGLQPGQLQSLASEPNLQQLKAKADLLGSQLSNQKTQLEIGALQNPSSTGQVLGASIGPGMSNDILSQAGLSLPAFYALTGQSSQLPRDKVTRTKAFNEAQQWAQSKGVDISTLPAEYKAQTEVVAQNIARANKTKIYAGEVSGSADALSSVIDQKDLGSGWFGIGKWKSANLLSLATGKETNDPLTLKYATQLNAMVNDYAGYLAASRGANEPVLADLQDSAKVISNGLNKGSVQAFKEAINANEQKVFTVVDKAVNDAQKGIWQLFGVTKPNGQVLGASTQQAPEKLLTPQEVPSGYYQASDGLLYKK